jgi:hypothetical protein
MKVVNKFTEYSYNFMFNYIVGLKVRYFWFSEYFYPVQHYDNVILKMKGHAAVPLKSGIRNNNF